MCVRNTNKILKKTAKLITLSGHGVGKESPLAYICTPPLFERIGREGGGFIELSIQQTRLSTILTYLHASITSTNWLWGPGLLFCLNI